MTRLRVATWNICGAIPQDGESASPAALHSLADLLNALDADIVGLQEVLFPSNDVSQAAKLGSMAGYAHMVEWKLSPDGPTVGRGNGYRAPISLSHPEHAQATASEPRPYTAHGRTSHDKGFLLVVVDVMGRPYRWLPAMVFRFIGLAPNRPSIPTSTDSGGRAAGARR